MRFWASGLPGSGPEVFKLERPGSHPRIHDVIVEQLRKSSSGTQGLAVEGCKGLGVKATF